MIATTIVALFITAGPESVKGEAHAANSVYRTVLDQGIAVDGRKVVLPAPRFRDGLTAQEQTSELRAIAGSERAVAELLRDSVSAPMILKTRDEADGQRNLIRGADVWFAVRGNLDDIQPNEASKDASKAKPIDVGNMRFSSHLLDEPAIASRKLDEAGSKSPADRWYVHSTSRLLDRIHVEATTLAMATRSPESWVIASRTDPRFANDSEFPNRWWPFTLQGNREVPGKTQNYEGGLSYLKINRLASKPGTLLVEAHFAFVEPKAWFDGAPILRSKISVIAQDQVRRLRREIAKKRESSTHSQDTR